MRGWRGLLGVLGELLITAGLLVLLFVGWQVWWTDVVAGRDQRTTVQALERSFDARTPASGSASGSADASAGAVPSGAFAIIRIPRFGADFARPVLDGVSLDVLSHGLGRYPGTAEPGAVGNFALAGHRTTWGRPLHEIDTIRAGDAIVIETPSEYVVYRMTSSEIVDPLAVDVIAPNPDRPGVKPTKAWLTLTACHPKYSAAQRFIVHAVLEKTYPRAGGIPAGVLTVTKG